MGEMAQYEAAEEGRFDHAAMIWHCFRSKDPFHTSSEGRTFATIHRVRHWSIHARPPQLIIGSFDNFMTRLFGLRHDYRR